MNDLHDRSYSHIAVSNISKFPGLCNCEKFTKFSSVYIVQIYHMDAAGSAGWALLGVGSGGCGEIHSCLLRIIQNHMQDCGFMPCVPVRVDTVSLKPYAFALPHREPVSIGADFNTACRYCDEFSGAFQVRL